MITRGFPFGTSYGCGHGPDDLGLASGDGGHSGRCRLQWLWLRDDERLHASSRDWYGVFIDDWRDTGGQVFT